MITKVLEIYGFTSTLEIDFSISCTSTSAMDFVGWTTRRGEIAVEFLVVIKHGLRGECSRKEFEISG